MPASSGLERREVIHTDARICCMYLDAQGLPRAYAVGPVHDEAAVIERATRHLACWCERLGHDPRDYRREVVPFEGLPPAPR